jgi:hypothetical protein
MAKLACFRFLGSKGERAFVVAVLSEGHASGEAFTANASPTTRACWSAAEHQGQLGVAALVNLRELADDVVGVILP